MLFETLKQSFLFLGSLYFGLILGIIKEIFLFLLKILKDNKNIRFIFDFLFLIISAILFIICLNLINYGEFRLFLLAIFILGYLIERKSIGYLLDFLFQKIYNLIVNFINKLKNTKLFKRIFYSDRKSSKEINKNR